MNTSSTPRAFLISELVHFSVVATTTISSIARLRDVSVIVDIVDIVDPSCIHNTVENYDQIASIAIIIECITSNDLFRFHRNSFDEYIRQLLQ